jgi:PAS domain S-box-containing protein
MNRVLIVGNSEPAVTRLTHTITSLEYVVAGTVKTGADALMNVERLGPDIVLMDVGVPGEINGIAAARLIREGFHTPVLLFVDHADKRSLSLIRKAKIIERCVDPTKPAELKTGIQEALRTGGIQKRSTRLYEELVESTYDLIHVQDGRGNITFINSAVTETLGYANNEIVGKNIRDFATPETYRLLKDMFKRQLGGETVDTFEMQVFDRQGNVKILETRERLIWDGNRIVEIQGISRDITGRKRIEKELVLLNRLKEQLLGLYDLNVKLKLITDKIVEIFDADFTRIWIVGPGDLCDRGCFHAGVDEGPHACRDRSRCLHLIAGSGRCTSTGEKMYRRIPIGAYGIGELASGLKPKYLTNDVSHDPVAHDHAWVQELGLTSFAGYRLLLKEGESVGVLALFSKKTISPDEDVLLEDIANTTAQVIQSSRTEEDLKKSEEQYRALFDNASFGIYHALPEGRLLKANKALASMLGYDSSEDLVSSVSDIAQDIYSDPSNRPRRLAEVMQKGDWDVFEERFRRKDGGIVDVRLHVRPVYGPDNVLEYLEGFTEDITEKRMTEEAIRKDRELKEKILQTPAVAMSFAEGRIMTWANTAFARTFGFADPSDCLGKSTSIIYATEEEYQRVGKLVYGEIGTGGVIETPVRLKRTDSTEFLGLLRVSVVYPDDPLREVVASFQDITEKTKAEEAIRRDQQLKEKILQTAGVGIAFAENREITWGNAAMEQTFGFANAHDYVGKSTSILYASDEEYRRVGKLVYGGGKSGEIIEAVAKFKRADSTEFLGLLRVSSVYPDDPIREIVVSILDITEKTKAEEAIRRDQQLKEKILQTAGVGIGFTKNRTLAWANPAMKQVLGLGDESDWVGRHTSIIYATDEEYKRVGKLLYEGSASEGVIETVVKFRRTDSTEFLGLLRASILNPADPTDEIVASISDITEKTKAEEALRESERRYRLLAENADDIIFTMDADLRFTYISPSVTRVRGFTVEEAMAQTPAEALTPESLKVGMRLFEVGMGAEAKGSGNPLTMQRVELEETCKDGSTIWTETTFSVLRDENNTFTGLLGITRDITERRQAEERIRILAELLDIFPASIAVHDLDGHFLFANQKIMDIHGYTEEEFSGLTVADLDAPEGSELYSQRLRYLADQGDISFEIEHLLKDGTKIPMIVNSRMARWEGTPVIMSVAIDIRERRQAEAALAESEVKYRMVVENAYEGIAVVQENVFVFANSRLLDIFGYTEREFLGRNYNDFLTTEDHDEADAEYQRKLRGSDYSYLSLFRIITKAGEIRWMEVSGVQILWEGKPALIIFVRDVTERKMIEQALIQSEAKYRDLIENAIDLIFTVDLEGNFLEVNESLLKQTGYSKQDIIAAGFREFVHPEDMEIALAAYEKGRKGQPHEFEMRSRKKDGTYEWYSFVIRPIPDINGNPEYVHCIARNITDRKAAEEALLESEMKFRGMFETSRDFMFISAKDGTVLDYNASAKDFFGYSDEEIRKTNINDIYADPDERSRVLERIIREGFVENYEIDLKKKDGTIIGSLVTSTVRRDRQGNVIGFQGSARDITKLKRIERQLLQAEKLSGLGTMISGVAHEINNPLTAIMGNAELMLMNDSTTPNDRKSLEVILHESERAARIVGGLLTFAREHTPERRMINVNDVIMEALRLREYSLRVSNIRTEQFLSDDLPATFADPYQLQQVFSNIINNARDALMDVGGGTLTIRTIRNGSKLFIEFQDDGPGVTGENIQKIFDPFFTTKDIGKGTGLGLSIAYGIIEEHNGRIEIESQPGAGAKFTVQLPIVGRAESAEIGAPSAPKTVPVGKTILVVDDERDVLEFLSRALTQYGYTVRTASSAEEALATMITQPFDAVIADIKMPGMGGKEMHAYIREHIPGAAEKVLFITGDILGDETQEFIASTGNICIKKPFKIGEFIARLNEIINP